MSAFISVHLYFVEMKLVSIFLLACIEQILTQSSRNDVTGKLVVGYQAWFGIPGDGSPRNTWIHWGNPPAPNHVTFELYPDMREYPKQYPSNLGNYRNGQPSKLFSSWDDTTIDLHFRWMQQYGIDVAALQVFYNLYTFSEKISSLISNNQVNLMPSFVILAFRFISQAKSRGR